MYDYYQDDADVKAFMDSKVLHLLTEPTGITGVLRSSLEPMSILDSGSIWKIRLLPLVTLMAQGSTLSRRMTQLNSM